MVNERFPGLFLGAAAAVKQPETSPEPCRVQPEVGSGMLQSPGSEGRSPDSSRNPNSTQNQHQKSSSKGEEGNINPVTPSKAGGHTQSPDWAPTARTGHSHTVTVPCQACARSSWLGVALPGTEPRIPVPWGRLCQAHPASLGHQENPQRVRTRRDAVTASRSGWDIKAAPGGIRDV